MQPANKPFQFNGTPGGYFVVTLVSLVTAYIPVFGWPFGFNYTAEWIAENLTVDGRRLQYSAGYGETLKFLFVNMLLVMVTFGIYMFWFGPKSYRYMVEHTSYVDAVPQPVPAMPAAPVAPQPPVAPVAPIS